MGSRKEDDGSSSVDGKGCGEKSRMDAKRPKSNTSTETEKENKERMRRGERTTSIVAERGKKEGKKGRGGHRGRRAWKFTSTWISASLARSGNSTVQKKDQGVEVALPESVESDFLADSENVIVQDRRDREKERKQDFFIERRGSGTNIGGRGKKTVFRDKTK